MTNCAEAAGGGQRKDGMSSFSADVYSAMCSQPIESLTREIRLIGKAVRTGEQFTVQVRQFHTRCVHHFAGEPVCIQFLV